jgi:hypothetical protein
LGLMEFANLSSNNSRLDADLAARVFSSGGVSPRNLSCCSNSLTQGCLNERIVRGEDAEFMNWRWFR